MGMILGFIVVIIIVIFRAGKQAKRRKSIYSWGEDVKTWMRSRNMRRVTLRFTSVFSLRIKNGRLHSRNSNSGDFTLDVQKERKLQELFFAFTKRGPAQWKEVFQEIFLEHQSRELFGELQEGAKITSLNELKDHLDEFHKLYREHQRRKVPFGDGHFFRARPGITAELFYFKKIPEQWILEVYQNENTPRYPDDFRKHMLVYYSKELSTKNVLDAMTLIPVLNRDELVQMLAGLPMTIQAPIYDGLWEIIHRLAPECRRVMIKRLLKQDWSKQTLRLLRPWVLEEASVRKIVLPELVASKDPKAHDFLVRNKHIWEVHQAIKDRLGHQEGTISLAEESGELSEAVSEDQEGALSKSGNEEQNEV